MLTITSYVARMNNTISRAFYSSAIFKCVNCSARFVLLSVVPKAKTLAQHPCSYFYLHIRHSGHAPIHDPLLPHVRFWFPISVKPAWHAKVTTEPGVVPLRFL